MHYLFVLNNNNFLSGLDNKESDVDSMPYTTLLYANGPGYNRNFPTGRENLTGSDTGKIFEILLYVVIKCLKMKYNF